MTLHALWCHPRSVSTAFERIMRERGDLTVLHEPFMCDYYLRPGNRTFEHFEPEPGHPTDYAGIRDMILDQSRKRPVFFKDMAYYVQDALPDDPEFMAAMSHAFLVRDPAEAALSYAKKDPAFTRLELGHEAQLLLFNALTRAGAQPLVMTADQLRADPEGTLGRYWTHVGLSHAPDAFQWDTSVPAGWKSVANWHSEVLESGAIRPASSQDTEARLAALGAPYTDHVAHHAPAYAALCDIAERQAHQK